MTFQRGLILFQSSLVSDFFGFFNGVLFSGSGLTNVALNKPSTQSTYHWLYGRPENVVDGNKALRPVNAPTQPPSTPSLIDGGGWTFWECLKSTPWSSATEENVVVSRLYVLRKVEPSLSRPLPLLSCCLTSTEARWPIRDGDRVGMRRESEGSIADRGDCGPPPEQWKC